MKSIELHADVVNSPKDIYNLLVENQLQKGDEVKFFSKDVENSTILVIFLLIVIVNIMEENKKQRQTYANQILDDVFSGTKSSDDIEKEIEEKYGIQIDAEIESNFRKEWAQAAVYNLEKFYGEDEPDYSDVEVKEPNPNFRKKKDK